MSERLREHFPTLYIFHGLTDNYNRYCVWYASLTSKSPLVIEVPELGQAEFENGDTIAVKLRKSQAFRNIQIIVNSGKWAMVSKNKAPVIHFVMRQPKMVDAIERFVPLVVEHD